MLRESWRECEVYIRREEYFVVTFQASICQRNRVILRAGEVRGQARDEFGLLLAVYGCISPRSAALSSEICHFNENVLHVASINAQYVRTPYIMLDTSAGGYKSNTRANKIMKCDR